MTKPTPIVLLVFMAFLTLLGCGSDAPATSATSSTTAETTAEAPTDTMPTLPAPDCTVKGDVLEGNRMWLKSADLLAVIKADATTAVEGFGPSHRILEILDGRTCEVKFTTTLAENTSPDFPYYIAPIQYNNISNLIGIQGYYEVYVCDLQAGYKLSKLKPRYFTEREIDDPQSGMIQRLEVWEDYLVGYAQDTGPFAFDLSDRSNPKAVLPLAEWQNDETATYHSLFLLPTQGGVQAIVPQYDMKADALLLYPLFDTPQAVSTNIQRSARNNDLIVLRTTDGAQTPLAINLRTRQLMTLPTDVASQNTQAILSWMRKQK